MIKQAMILAAGFGKRMLPLTNHIPKPLVMVKDVSLLERTLDDLLAYGIEKIVINSHHKADKIKDFIPQYIAKKSLKQREMPVIKLLYEDVILETGGAIVNALSEFGTEPFFVINGDILILHNKNQNIYQMMNNAWQGNMVALFLLQDPTRAIGYEGNGDFDLDNQDRVLDSNNNHKKYIFAGIHITTPKLFQGYEIQNFSVINVYKKFDYKNIYGFVNPLDWLHIGTVESIKEAEKFIDNKKN